MDLIDQGIAWTETEADIAGEAGDYADLEAGYRAETIKKWLAEAGARNLWKPRLRLLQTYGPGLELWSCTGRFRLYRDAVMFARATGHSQRDAYDQWDHQRQIIAQLDTVQRNTRALVDPRPTRTHTREGLWTRSRRFLGRNPPLTAGAIVLLLWAASMLRTCNG